VLELRLALQLAAARTSRRWLETETAREREREERLRREKREQAVYSSRSSAPVQSCVPLRVPVFTLPPTSITTTTTTALLTLPHSPRHRPTVASPWSLPRSTLKPAQHSLNTTLKERSEERRSHLPTQPTATATPPPLIIIITTSIATRRLCTVARPLTTAAIVR
jgi:hypothetical protein